MRAAALLLALVSILPLTFVAPQVGVLLWSWLSFMSPQQLIYLPASLPLVYIVALVTGAAWLFSSEPKRLPANITPWLIILFMADVTLSSSVSISPGTVWHLWDRNIKTMVLALALMALITNRIRLHSLVWTMVLSIGFYSVKGAIFTLLTAGASRVQGPPDTMIADNNTLGLAMVMTWPLMHYLWQSSENRMIRLGLAIAMALSVVAILGTYSRGAFVAFFFTLIYFWWKSDKKILFAALGVCVIVPAIWFMPAQWVDRMNTIDDSQQDSSVQGRFDAWGVAMRIAADRPLTGVGFDAMVQPIGTQLYGPPIPGYVAHVAHSIWFEPLADNGIPGLAIFVAIGLTAWLQANMVRKRTRFAAEWTWAHNLATVLQLSLAGYFAAGTFLSMPYYDLYYAIIASTSVLYDMVARAETRVHRSDELSALSKVAAVEQRPRSHI